MSMEAFIFLCDSTTKRECFEKLLLGTNNQYYFEKYFSKIAHGDYLFLFDMDSKNLIGSLRAASTCSKNISDKAWNGKFPFQVEFKIDGFLYEIALAEISQFIGFYGTPYAHITGENANALLKRLGLI